VKPSAGRNQRTPPGWRTICRISRVKRTKTLARVATALMEDPNGRHWGYDLSKRSRVRSGVVYPLLTRLLDAGWLADGWEQGVEGRPPRRYYELTEDGRGELGAIAQTPAR
jgi:PadR family transcriptional regulator PadR